jgi:hypothetical protein
VVCWLVEAGWQLVSGFVGLQRPLLVACTRAFCLPLAAGSHSKFGRGLNACERRASCSSLARPPLPAATTVGQAATGIMHGGSQAARSTAAAPASGDALDITALSLHQQPAAMSYSYGPTQVVYPAAFTMSEAFPGAAGFDAKENSGYAAYALPAKVRARRAADASAGAACVPRAAPAHLHLLVTRRRPSWCTRTAAAPTAQHSRCARRRTAWSPGPARACIRANYELSAPTGLHHVQPGAPGGAHEQLNIGIPAACSQARQR